tara:strand:- start:156 stop:467 length:312 start_codon:yes stop_codon:yes gene_type:complete
LEKNETHSANFETEPYETGWASEARFFIRPLKIEPEAGAAALTAHVQVSADGLHWCDEGTTLVVKEEQVHSVRVRDFGGWLRLRCELSDGSTFKLLVYLVLKE